jgi:hypothetical protein
VGNKCDFLNGSWQQSDESVETVKEKNPIKEYLENVMNVIVKKYWQPFILISVKSTAIENVLGIVSLHFIDNSYQ